MDLYASFKTERKVGSRRERKKQSQAIKYSPCGVVSGCLRFGREVRHSFRRRAAQTGERQERVRRGEFLGKRRECLSYFRLMYAS